MSSRMTLLPALFSESTQAYLPIKPPMSPLVTLLMALMDNKSFYFFSSSFWWILSAFAWFQIAIWAKGLILKGLDQEEKCSLFGEGI